MRVAVFTIFQGIALSVPLLAFGQFDNPIGAADIQTLLANVIQAVVLILTPIVVLFVVYTGFLFVSASGNEEKLNKAKQAFFWTMLGALIVLGAQVLATAIQGTISEISGGL